MFTDVRAWRQPSPRGYSPRMRSARDPPPHALSQKRLPEHVRLLTLAPPGGGAPVFDGQATPRGRYSPSFAANAARPFDPVILTQLPHGESAVIAQRR